AGPNNSRDNIRPIETASDWTVNSLHGPRCLTHPLVLDPVNGRLLIPLISFCYGDGLQCTVYSQVTWMAAISGFSALFEIIQTYSPNQTNLSYRGPGVPEGLRAAEHFDPYWGNVSDLPNF